MTDTYLPAGTGADDEREVMRAIVAESPVILFRRLPAPDPRLVYISPNVSRFGWSAEDFLAERVTWRSLVHPEDMERMRAEIRDHAERGSETYVQEYRVRTRKGEERWVHDTTTTVRDSGGAVVYYQGVITDVTERKIAEIALRESEERHRRILGTAAEGFVRMSPELRILEANETYCRMLGYEPGEVAGRHVMDLAAPEYARWLAANRETLLARERRIFEGALLAKDGRTVPVLVHANTLRDGAGNVEGHVAFVTDLTEQKRSLRLAAEVQQSLLPREMPRVPGLEVAARSLPCEDLGGDYFDLMAGEGPDGWSLTAAVGDISGHGVDSALLMAAARGTLRHHLTPERDLGAALAGTNRDLFDDFLATSRFMTLLAVRLSPEGLEWARAGQDPPLLYDPDADAFASLMGSGLPLGVIPDAAYGVERISPLPSRAFVILGTDGIWEAQNGTGELFGKERFMAIVRRNAPWGPTAVLEAVFAAVLAHTGGQRLADDVTLVVVGPVFP